MIICQKKKNRPEFRAVFYQNAKLTFDIFYRFLPGLGYEI